MTLHTHRKQQPQPPSRVLPGFTPKRTLLTVSLRAALIGLAAGAMTLPQSAVAQESAAQASVQRFDIPAGPLDGALDRFARAAGVNLSYDRALIAGRTSRGLAGQYGVRAGLQALLADTDIEAHPQAGGGFTLKKAVVLEPRSGEAALTPVKVTADADRSGITEDTGSYTSSYTTHSTSSATPLDLSVRQTPQSVTVMTHDRMQDQGLTKMDEVLERVVGIEPDRRSALGGDTVGYYSRGFQVKNFQVDGVARPGALYGFFEDTVDMIAYDRVEVVRGPSGLMTGTGTPSATVNLIRKKAADTFKGMVSASAGSWGLRRTEVDITGPLAESGKVRGRFAASLQDNDTFVDREHVDRSAIFGTIEADISEKTSVSLGFEYQKFLNSGASRGGIPLFYQDGSETKLSRSTNSGTDWSRFGRESTNVFATLNHAINKDWKIDVTAEHKEGSYDQKFGYAYASALGRAGGNGASMYNTRFAGDVKLDAINARLKGEFDLLGRRHGLAINAFHASYASRAPDYPIWYSGAPYREVIGNVYDFYRTGDWAQPDLTTTGKTNGNDIKTTAVSGVMRLNPIDGVSLILGSRITNWKHDRWNKDAVGTRSSTPYTKESGVITPYGGLVVDITDNWSLYGSYTSVFDPQNVKDLTGNVLKPLEGKNKEVGAKGEYFGGRLNIGVALFSMRQENYPVQEGLQVLAPDGSRAYRPEHVKANGFELEMSGRISPNWQVAGGFAHAKLKGTERAPLSLTRIPENTFKLFTSYRPGGALSGLTIGGGVRWQDSVYLDGIGPNKERYTQKSFFVADAMVQYQIQKNFVISVNLNNIFDKTYYEAIDTGASRYGTPRNFTLTGRYIF